MILTFNLTIWTRTSCIWYTVLNTLYVIICEYYKNKTIRYRILLIFLELLTFVNHWVLERSRIGQKIFPSLLLLFFFWTQWVTCNVFKAFYKNNVYKYVDIVGRCWYVFSQFSKNSWRVKFSLFLSFAWNWKTAGKKLKTNFAILKVPFLDFFFQSPKSLGFKPCNKQFIEK